MTPAEFAAKWAGSTRTERAASQEHFIDLCRMIGVQTPNEADPSGNHYAFEKGAEKTGGGDGFEPPSSRLEREPLAGRARARRASAQRRVGWSQPASSSHDQRQLSVREEANWA